MTDPLIVKRNRGNKRNGAKWEIDLTAYLTERGYDAERKTKTGRNDQGDLVVRLLKRLRQVLLIEAKNEKTFNLGGYIREAEIEAANYEAAHYNVKAHPVAIVKRRQHGVGGGYVVMTVDAFLDLLDE